jgi:hypothetical protein
VKAKIWRIWQTAVEEGKREGKRGKGKLREEVRKRRINRKEEKGGKWKRKLKQRSGAVWAGAETGAIKARSLMVLIDQSTKNNIKQYQ